MRYIIIETGTYRQEYYVEAASTEEARKLFEEGMAESGDHEEKEGFTTVGESPEVHPIEKPKYLSALIEDPVLRLGFTRILTSDYNPKEGCSLRCKVVLWRRDCRTLGYRFGTHLEVLQENGITLLHVGHYDLSFIGAAQDFMKRCAVYGCKEW